jgi:hypothetical protein
MSLSGPSGTTGWDHTIIDHIVTLMGNSAWQTIESGRPLLYVYDSGGLGEVNWGSAANLGTALNKLRTAATTAGLPNPYLVGLRSTSTNFGTIGFDAISQYSTPPTGTIQQISYASLIAPVESLWTSQVGTGYPVIPACMTGWDDRALDNWMCISQAFGPYPSGPSPWSAKGSNSAVANHIKAARDFCLANPTHTPAEQHVVVYAWDEALECGNGLGPTLLDPAGSLLQQVSTTLSLTPSFSYLYDVGVYDGTALYDTGIASPSGGALFRRDFYNPDSRVGSRAAAVF